MEQRFQNKKDYDAWARKKRQRDEEALERYDTRLKNGEPGSCIRCQKITNEGRYELNRKEEPPQVYFVCKHCLYRVSENSRRILSESKE